MEKSTKYKLDTIAKKLGVSKRKAAEYCIHSVFDHLNSLPFTEDKSSEVSDKLDLILSKLDEFLGEV